MNTRCFIVALVVLASGCGLKDYEERMDQEAKRVRLFDQTEGLLDAALLPPPSNEKNSWRFDVFLRVPRGCRYTAAKAAYPGGGKDKELTLFRYPFALGNVPEPSPLPMKDKAAPVAEVPQKPGWNLFVACSASAVASKTEFARRVLTALRLYCETELESGLDTQRRDLVDVAFQVDGVQIEFAKMELDGPWDTQFQLFVHEHDRRTVALIFQTPAEAAPLFAAARDACLKTLDIPTRPRPRKIASRALSSAENDLSNNGRTRPCHALVTDF